jgi:hypothetical protein
MPTGGQAESAVTEPRPGLDLATDLVAAAALSVYCYQVVEETHSREKARDEPTCGRVVNA